MTTRRRLSFVLAVSLALGTYAANARDIVDMAGRTVTIPDILHKVAVQSHTLAPVTVLAPELVPGMPFPFKAAPAAMRFLPPAYATLPNLDNSLEKMKALGVDFVLGFTTAAYQRDQVPQFQRIGLPVVLLDIDRLDQYPQTLRFLGGLFHQEERAESLAGHIEGVIKTVEAATATVPADRKKRVYYAESMDGLTTQCDKSDRSEVIARAGALNAVTCEAPVPMSDARQIDLETLLTLAPDAIVTRFPETALKIKHDPRWQRLAAVRDGRVYPAPTLPFNWFDRPPSFMRALGAWWLAAKLYPDLPLSGLDAEVRDFYKLFFNVALSDADLAEILGQ